MSNPEAIRRLAAQYPVLRGARHVPWYSAMTISTVLNNLRTFGSPWPHAAIWAAGIAGSLLINHFYKRRYGVVHQITPEPPLGTAVLLWAPVAFILLQALSFRFRPPIEPGLVLMGGLMMWISRKGQRSNWMIPGLATLALSVLHNIVTGTPYVVTMSVVFGVAWCVAWLMDHRLLMRRWKEAQLADTGR